MAAIQIYHNEKDIPPLLHQQIIDFQRMQWAEGFVGENQYRNWICHEDFEPVFFLLTKDDILISHASVVHQQLEYGGYEFITYGIAGVFTYPSFQKQGYGLQIINVAKKYIETTDADIILFTTCRIGFYEKAGFIPMKETKIFHGDKKNPTWYQEDVYMEFLSEKGREYRSLFEHAEIFFGEHVW